MRELSLTIAGNLTADPELRFTPTGVARCVFTIAHTPRVRKGDEWTDGEPTFMRCNAWRQLAENIAESLAKGHRVIATGTLETQRWETKEGEKREGLVLNVTAIGPELSYATATVKKMSRSNERPGDEEWATASKQRPAGDVDNGPEF